MSPSMPLRALGLAACCAAPLTVRLAGVEVQMTIDANDVVTMSHDGGTGASADPRWLSLGIGKMADGKCVLIDGMGTDPPTEWTLAGNTFASMTLVTTDDLKGGASVDGGKRSLNMTVPPDNSHVIIGVGITKDLDFDKSRGHRAEMTVTLDTIRKGGGLDVMQPPVTQKGSASTTIQIAGTSVEMSVGNNVVTASHTGHSADPRWLSLGTGTMTSGRCVIVDVDDDSVTEWTLAGRTRASMTKVDAADATLKGGASVADGRQSVSITVPDSEAHVILAVGIPGQPRFGTAKHQGQTTVQLTDIGNASSSSTSSSTTAPTSSTSSSTTAPTSSSTSSSTTASSSSTSSSTTPAPTTTKDNDNSAALSAVAAIVVAAFASQ